MSAKKKNRPAVPPKPAAKPAPVAAAATSAALPEVAAPVAVPEVALEQTPRRRLISNVVMVAVCIYIAMLYLLAADQQFKWGIFGP